MPLQITLPILLHDLDTFLSRLLPLHSDSALAFPIRMPRNIPTLPCEKYNLWQWPDLTPASLWPANEGQLDAYHVLFLQYRSRALLLRNHNPCQVYRLYPRWYGKLHLSTSINSLLWPLSAADKPALSSVWRCSHQIPIPTQCVNQIRPPDRINVPMASIVPPLDPQLVHREPQRPSHVHISQQQERDHSLTYLNLYPELILPLPPPRKSAISAKVQGRPRKYSNDAEGSYIRVQRYRERKKHSLPTPQTTPPDEFCNIFLIWRQQQ